MNRLLRWIFILCVAYPVVLIWLGVSVANRKNLPLKGPAIVIANHNSHLDVLTLFTLFPFPTLSCVQPVAAADYFLRNRLVAWFALKVIGIIPIRRVGSGRSSPLEGCVEALQQGKIIILFPEGTRGEPECFSEFKTGLWHLNRKMPEVPIVPVYMRGLGRAMGKGQKIPVPFFIDVWIDEPMNGHEDKATFQKILWQRFIVLQRQAEGKNKDTDKPDDSGGFIYRQ